MVIRIETIYLKELECIDEIIIKKNRNFKLLNLIKMFFKKVSGSVTIKENNIAIIPYRNFKRFKIIKIYFIKKVLEKLKVKVVLSKYLNEIEELKYELNKVKVEIIEGNDLTRHIIIPIIDYISKIKKEDIEKQEITILAENCNEKIKEQITEISTRVKRVNIVTTNLRQFERLEKYLNENLGIAISITNNKRKSLLKSNIIINIDFAEEVLNRYSINTEAIIINLDTNIEVKSKLFNGINVYDYQIVYSNYLNDSECKSFDKKALYQSTIVSKNYSDVQKQMKKDKLRIVNLIGKNGIIDTREFLKV